MTVLIYFYDISFVKDKSYKMNSHHLSKTIQGQFECHLTHKIYLCKANPTKSVPLRTWRWFPWLYVVGILDAYHSPKVRTEIRIPKDMGIVWETYHKGVPLWGVPGNTIEKILSIVFQPPIFYFSLKCSWFRTEDCISSWESKGSPAQCHGPPGDRALLGPYRGMVGFSIPYFSGGNVGGFFRHP